MKKNSKCPEKIPKNSLPFFSSFPENLETFHIETSYQEPTFLDVSQLVHTMNEQWHPRLR